MADKMAAACQFASIRCCGHSNLVIFNWISSKFHIWFASFKPCFKFEYEFCPTNDSQDGRHMRGSRNFRQGGPGQSDKKGSVNVFFFFFFFFFLFFAFLVLRLFYRSQMVNFKEIYHFSRFQRGQTFSRGRGSNFFQGGVQLLIPYRNPYNL